MASGGSIGIRTLETVPRLHTFQACAFDHSATDPLAVFSPALIKGARGESGYHGRFGVRATPGAVQFGAGLKGCRPGRGQAA